MFSFTSTNKAKSVISSNTNEITTLDLTDRPFPVRHDLSFSVIILS